ncbi:DUF4123 domain-containing protein [Luteimonas abyssi]|uniref:DUF4123 domain-containing protein n=1 Tax=Luteimonas abyssi TaxID=1247514 RepID=UPI0009E880C7|nr:DUF4123 domain-containing protein [Luteimonas abyssi]
MQDLDHRRLLAHDYALINPLQVDSQFWQDLPIESVAPEEAKDAGLYPLLLQFSRLPHDERIDLLDRDGAHRRHSRKPFFSALLRAPVPWKELVVHLRRQMVLRGPPPAREQALLRYYDPVVFRHLLWLLNQKQRLALLGGITHWSWCDPQHGWQQYLREGAQGSMRMTPTLEQWDTLKRLGLLNRSLSTWARSEPDLLGQADLWRRADAVLGESLTLHRLQDEVDRRQYATLELRYPGVHRHPDLLERLSRAQSGAISYSEACRDLDSARLRCLAAELETPSVAMEARRPQ